MTPGSDTSPIRILVADDHPMTREGIAMILGNQDDMQVVAEAEDGQKAVEQPAGSTDNVAGTVFGGGTRKGAGFGWWWHTPDDTLDNPNYG